MNKLLIDDYPIQVLPKLAKEIGLNEAIFVQQLHYWINGKSGKTRDGKRWIYNTYKDWENQFPFWSNATIRRTINSCEKKKMIIEGNFNRAGFDNTKWYTVNYEEIKRVSKRLAQNEQTTCSKRANGHAQNEQTNTIDYTETTTETNKTIMSGKPEDAVERIPYKEIITYLNEKADRDYKFTANNNRKLIRERWNEGYRYEDFKQVIDNMTKLWGDSEKMKPYLRPLTLFGNKFDEYRNKIIEQPNRAETSEYADLF